MTKGADQIGTYNKSANSMRKWCKACGGHLMTEHPAWGSMDVYAATTPGFAFKPGVHVNYQEAVLAVRDGLSKMKDLPAEMGGSGQTVAESEHAA